MARTPTSELVSTIEEVKRTRSIIADLVQVVENLGQRIDQLGSRLDRLERGVDPGLTGPDA